MPSQEPLTTIAGHQRQFNPRLAPGRRQKGGFAMPSDTLTITDNRTATKYDLPIENGTIRAMDLRKIKTGPDDFGLMTYDPAFMNTASCHRSITFIDDERGILRYRGYPIERGKFARTAEQ
jgi:citrate synthase